MSLHIKAELDLVNGTWADLRRYVEMNTHRAADEPLGLVLDAGDDICALGEWLPGDGGDVNGT